MSETWVEPRVGPDSRLLLTIVIAAAVHAMVVLGVRLPPEPPVTKRYSAMEVVLVPAPSNVSTVQDVSAVDGASASDKDEPPVLPMAPIEPAPIKAAAPPVIAAPATPVKPAPTVRSAAKAPPKVTPKASPPPAAAATSAPGTSDAATTQTTPNDSSALPLPSGAQLLARSLAIAATGAGLIEDRTVSGESKSERTLYIKNNTRDWTEIAYAEGLRTRAKRFGELFERDVPSGSVGLDVAVASDGSLAGVVITKSSGIEATDAKAVRIIEKAAPYSPLPPQMAKKFDVAHIEFTMNITQDEGFDRGH